MGLEEKVSFPCTSQTHLTTNNENFAIRVFSLFPAIACFPAPLLVSHSVSVKNSHNNVIFITQIVKLL